MRFFQIKLKFMMMNNASTKKHYVPWLVCIISSLFFLYEFIQINMFNTISTGILWFKMVRQIIK